MRLVDSRGVLCEQSEFVAQLDDRPDIQECLATLEREEVTVLAKEQATRMIVPAAADVGSKASAVIDEADMWQFDELVRRVLFAPQPVESAGHPD